MKQQITVEYESPVKVTTGMMLWAIEQEEHKTIYAKCPVCDDTRQLTVNNHTFSCPECARLAKSTSFSHFVVRKYIVCGIEISTPSDYWKDAEREPRVVFAIFRKYGRSTYESRQRQIHASHIDSDRFNRNSADNYAFSSYSQACAIARDLNAEEDAKLAAYNAEHGTDHSFEWQKENDKEEKARGSIA